MQPSCNASSPAMIFWGYFRTDGLLLLLLIILNGLNPGVSLVCLVWSSGGEEYSERLLLVTTWAVVIFRVKWRFFIKWWYLCLWSRFWLVLFSYDWLFRLVVVLFLLSYNLLFCIIWVFEQNLTCLVSSTAPFLLPACIDRLHLSTRARKLGGWGVDGYSQTIIYAKYLSTKHSLFTG